MKIFIEERVAAIEQFRRSLTFKASPLPSFYREGPQAKVELKKPFCLDARFCLLVPPKLGWTLRKRCDADCRQIKSRREVLENVYRVSFELQRLVALSLLLGKGRTAALVCF
ncbi:hypothetical protein V6N11_046469 [Hibiscus sabdariffa]|uniref:TPX2 C-terminal domain-containing protein n=2 Tax=Hibiscus sabdariffa TaxID=183260 RepID=A0ABR2BW25_9ROSI